MRDLVVPLAFCLTLLGTTRLSADEKLALPNSDEEAAGAIEPPPSEPPRPWNAFESRWINGLLFGGMALDFVRQAQNPASREQIGDLANYENTIDLIAKDGVIYRNTPTENQIRKQEVGWLREAEARVEKLQQLHGSFKKVAISRRASL